MQTIEDRYIDAEQRVAELIDKLPKAVLAQVMRMLAQNLIHHRQQTGIEISIEDTMIAMNCELSTEQKHLLNIEALAELTASKLAAANPSKVRIKLVLLCGSQTVTIYIR